MPADPINELLADLSTILPSHYNTLAQTPNILSSSTSVPPPAQLALTTASIDLSMALMGQMSILFKQQDHMIAEITQLQTASKHHITEFATLKGAIVYVQCGISGCVSTGIMRLMLVILMRTTTEMMELHSCVGIPLSFVTKRWSINCIVFGLVIFDALHYSC